ncbi:MAG: uncharacterized protein PWQ55_702 [Chloroflexota bacterium]|nr:uncharacterized protein [Chloroflexota bacterium]
MDASFRFYAELNEFLPKDRQYQTLQVRFNDGQSVKHLIESSGIPHTEVDLVLANGRSVDFSYLVRGGDCVAVYPVFESMDISPLLRLRPAPLREARFVLDGHLGRLAAYLRMLGFDALYRNDYDDPELAQISADQKRILLTRDRGLLKRSLVTRGYCLRTREPRRQLLDVMRRFDLLGQVRPFTRCMACNGLLARVDKAEIEDQLQPLTRKYFQEFSRCVACGKVYWKGSHHERMQALLAWLEAELNEIPTDF